MGREDYRGATAETKAALQDHIKEIADEMGLDAPQYLYAVLAGKESDPFARFKRLFRAVARKNPEGARGYIASLTTEFQKASPEKSEGAKLYDVTRTFNDMLAVSAEAEEGLCPAEKFEAVKDRHVETVGKFRAQQGRPTQAAVNRMTNQSAG
jgi:hypothetical protein